MILSKDIIGSEFKYDEILPFLVEVTLPEPINKSFLCVRETLARIGIASSKPNEENTLFQTCHILKKKERYYIVHFKTLFVLEGRKNTLTINDISRANFITKLLEDWGLVVIVKPDMIGGTTFQMSNLKIVPYSEKDNWVFKPKYQIGKKKERE